MPRLSATLHQGVSGELELEGGSLEPLLIQASDVGLWNPTGMAHAEVRDSQDGICELPSAPNLNHCMLASESNLVT